MSAPEAGRSAAAVPHGRRVARLMSRLYRSADASLRARTIASLVQPLGTLGLAAVAAGSFLRFAPLLRRGEVPVALEEVVAVNSDQMLELASFVEQVSPQTLHQVATMLADNPAATTAFGLVVVLALRRACQRLQGS